MTLIKLDIDDKRNPIKLGEELAFRLQFATELFQCEEKHEMFALVDVAETNKGFHIIVNSFSQIPDATVIMLQLALGSDWKRELFNWKRATNGQFQNNNTLFSEKKRYDKKTKKWETISKEERYTPNTGLFYVGFKTKGIKEKVKSYFRQFKEIKGASE